MKFIKSCQATPGDDYFWLTAMQIEDRIRLISKMTSPHNHNRKYEVSGSQTAARVRLSLVAKLDCVALTEKQTWYLSCAYQLKITDFHSTQSFLCFNALILAATAFDKRSHLIKEKKILIEIKNIKKNTKNQYLSTDFDAFKSFFRQSIQNKLGITRENSHCKQILKFAAKIYFIINQE